MNMRTFLSELGCLPVSTMIHLPKAQEILTESGDIAEGTDIEAWRGYFDRTLTQLEWWAAAAKGQRAARGLPTGAPAFLRDPSQRNAP